MNKLKKYSVTKIDLVISKTLQILGLQSEISKVFFSHSRSEQFWRQNTYSPNVSTNPITISRIFPYLGKDVYPFLLKNHDHLFQMSVHPMNPMNHPNLWSSFSVLNFGSCPI